MLNAGFNLDTLPEEWFCNMPPFNGKCEVPEQRMGRGVIMIGEKRSGYDEHKRVVQLGETTEKEMRSGYPETQDEEDVKSVQGITAIGSKRRKPSGTSPMHKNNEDDLDGAFSQTEDNEPRPILKPRPILRRLRRGPAKLKQ